MRSKKVFEALPYSIAFMRYEGFTGRCKRRFLCPILTLQQDVRKVSLNILGHIYTFLKSLLYSELSGVIFNFVGYRNHKLWPYN